MRGCYCDGRTARVHDLEVRVIDAALAFEFEGDHRWPLAGLAVEIVDDRVRLAQRHGGAERLTLDGAEWRALSTGSDAYRRAEKRRGALLIGVLAASAATIAAVVFLGVPLAAGPLARATPPAMERRLGETFDAQLAAAFRPCAGEAGQAALQGLGSRLERAAGSPFEIRVRAVQAPMANAFALPGGSVMVTGDLIDTARTPDELSAVIAHEVAHVQKRHVMQAVWRSFGFGILLDAVVGGGSGAGQQAVLLLGSITNLRFSRQAEAEADATGQDLLRAQGLSSEGMATFFRRLAPPGQGPDARALSELLSDHPDNLRRSAASQARAAPGVPAFTAAEWRAIKAACTTGKKPRP